MRGLRRHRDGCFRWFFNGQSLSGATGQSLTLTNIQAAQAGDYHVLVTNDAGSVLSADATLSVVPSAPFFTTQPQNAFALLGQPTTFTGVANGTEPIFYQWLANGAPLAGATTSTLTLSQVQPTDGGAYSTAISRVASRIAANSGWFSAIQSTNFLN